MRLIRAELTRLYARRFTRISLVGLLLLLAVIAFAVAASTRKPTEADLVAAKIAVEQNRTETNYEYQRCLDQQGQPGAPGASPGPPVPPAPTPSPGGPGATAGPTAPPVAPGDKPFPPGFDCHQITAHMPTEDDFLPESFNLARVGPDMFRALGVILAMFGFIVGASFIGAEWSSGGVMMLLLWRPRRIPVWLGKLASLLLGVLGISAALSILWYATLWLLATRGGSAAMTAGELRSLVYTDVRAVVLALAATALGYSISALGRNTATALGVAVGWVMASELGGRVILAVLQVSRPERWFLSTYVSAWLSKSVRLYDYGTCRDDALDICKPVEWTISMQQGALVGGIIVLLIAGVSLYAFRQRDVT